jgi:hypothetical protein
MKIPECQFRGTLFGVTAIAILLLAGVAHLQHEIEHHDHDLASYYCFQVQGFEATCTRRTSQQFTSLKVSNWFPEELPQLDSVAQILPVNPRAPPSC